MKVKHLQDILSKIDPEALIVVSAYDHSYREVSRATQTTAEYNKEDRYLGEYWDNQNLADGSITVPVVVIQ